MLLDGLGLHPVPVKNNLCRKCDTLGVDTVKVGCEHAEIDKKGFSVEDGLRELLAQSLEARVENPVYFVFFC